MDDIARKYGMPTLQDAIDNWDCDEQTAKDEWYRSFLNVTDHIPNKMTEQFFETLAKATITSFLSDMFGFIRDVYTEYKPILDARKECRQEINRIENQEQGN